MFFGTDILYKSHARRRNKGKGAGGDHNPQQLYLK